MSRRPEIASLVDGGFVIVWMAHAPGDFQTIGLWARRYDALGRPQGLEERVDDGGAEIWWPAAVGLPDGGVLTTWAIVNDGSGSGVAARRFAANGMAEGDVFRVNSHVAGHQNSPVATALAGGGVLIGWVSEGQDGSGLGVYGQRYQPDGPTQGSEVPFHTTTAGDQWGIAVAALSDGGSLGVWLSNEGGLATKVRGQRFDAGGNRLGGEIQLAEASMELDTPVAAGLRGGGVVVVWRTNNTSALVGRVLDATGAAVGEEFVLSAVGRQPDVTALADGGFLVAWSAGWTAEAQRFDATARPVGETFRLNRNPESSVEYPPRVAAGAEGGFTATWGEGLQIFAQRFVTYGPFALSVDEGTATGTPLGDLRHAVMGSASYGISEGNDDNDGDGTPAFALDPITGLLQVADGDDLDYETRPTQVFTIRAFAAGGLMDTGTVTVRLRNVDEPGNEPPELAAQGFTVQERSPTGTLVGTILVSDIDAGDAQTFTITSGNADRNNNGMASFRLESTTGRLLVEDGDDLDFEASAEIELMVRVTDSGGLFAANRITIRLENIDEIYGTEGNDLLTCGRGPTWINGLGGNDDLRSGIGNDTLHGGGGIDRILAEVAGDGRLDNERLSGMGEDHLSGIERAELVAANTLAINRRLDARDFSRGAVRLSGGSGNDLLYAPSKAGSAHAGAPRQSRWIAPTDTYNILDGARGDDTLIGGAGFDALMAENGGGHFVLGAGLFTGIGTAHFSSIEFAILNGLSGGDILDASGFNGECTQLQGGGSNDTLIGGAAIDCLKFAESFSSIRISDTELFAFRQDWWTTDTLVEMDAAKIIAGEHPITIDASAFTGSRVIYEGGDGDDILIGREVGRDRVRARLPWLAWDVVIGSFVLTDSQLRGLGTDQFEGFEEAELLGNPGDNLFDVSAFTGLLTIMEGGEGNDTYRGRQGGIDRVRARGNVDFLLINGRLTGVGIDVLEAIDEVELIGDGDANRLDASAFSQGSVLLYGECGDDVLLGGAGNDLLSGGPGNNTLVGGEGLDRIEGRGDTDFVLGATTLQGLGLDVFSGVEEAVLGGGPSNNRLDASGFRGQLVIFEGQQGDDTLIGREVGLDRVRAEGDTNFLLSNERLTGLGNDTLVGIDEAELIGYSGSNIFDARAFSRGSVRLDGGNSNDTLYGGGAADTLIGGAGADQLSGLGGGDSFTLNVLAESRLAQLDQILDYQGGGATPDRIDAPEGVAAVILTASVGEASSAEAADLQALLTPALLRAGGAAAFTIAGHGGTYLALGDVNPGFQASGDGLLALPNLLLTPTAPIVVV
jgi:serralysin